MQMVLEQLRRADIVEDCGKSMNPFVDIGQVEGAFIMGVGLYTSELVKFDVETGVKLSNGTWVCVCSFSMRFCASLQLDMFRKGAEHGHSKGGSASLVSF